MREVFVYKNQLVFICINMGSKLTGIWKLPFEAQGVFEYRLRNRLQNKGLALTTGSIAA
jgi:hypothetical protein